MSFERRVLGVLRVNSKAATLTSRLDRDRVVPGTN
jgi:hypothetical protein